MAPEYEPHAGLVPMTTPSQPSYKMHTWSFKLESQRQLYHILATSLLCATDYGKRHALAHQASVVIWVQQAFDLLVLGFYTSIHP